ncbi:hypothetical protein Gotur_016845 [Gossypium turneri]|uniref:Uncharacterized protein n=1 Tax=Gossypium aridum TaxID=34290 RepID=A0A7J8XUF5_GOSAI|nr:hypothetical protein [Gossypium aridum]
MAYQNNSFFMQFFAVSLVVPSHSGRSLIM